LKDLADIHFAHAKTIVLVQDNLSTHSKAREVTLQHADSIKLGNGDELHHTMEWFSTYDIASSYSTKL